MRPIRTSGSEGKLIRRASKLTPDAVWRAETDKAAASQLNSLTNAFERYSGAIRSLAAGHGGLSQRLHHAWVESIMHVRPEGLPESMRRSTEYIMESLRDHPSLDEEQQSDLAAEIVTIYTEIAQALEREKPKIALR